MKTQLKQTLKSLTASGVIALMAVSCSAPKDITYFQNLPEEVVLESTVRNSIKIEPESKLSIVVKSKDPAISDLFNLGVYTNRTGQTTPYSGTGTHLTTYNTPSNEGMSAYTVDPQGDIDFPMLGRLHVSGMTRSELAGFIKGELMGRELVKDPVVTVEFLNAGINVMGEVNSPGRYDINKDHLTVLDALALANDLPITARRENVRVLRQEDGKLKSYTLNLTDAQSMMASPGFYLKQNDVVYVEPNEMQKRSATVNGNNVLNVSFWISVVSLLTSVAILIVK